MNAHGALKTSLMKPTAKIQNKTPRKYKTKHRENTKQNTAKIQNEMLRKYKTKHRENAKQATFYGYTQRLPSSAQDRKMGVEWRLDAAATPFDGGMSSLP